MRCFYLNRMLVIFGACMVGFTQATAATVCSPPPSGLVGWWAGAGNGVDSAGFSDGILNNGVSFVAGKVGKAFSFDGVNQSVSISRAVIMPATNQFSVATWIYVNSHILPYDPVVVSRNTAGSGFTMEFYNTNQLSTWLCLNGSCSTPVVSPSAIPMSKWVHAAATYSGTTLSLFINGALVNSQQISAQTLPTANVVNFGGYPYEGRFSNELLDEVSLFNRALSPAEIQAIYKAGSAGMCALPNESFGAIMTGALPKPGTASCTNLTTGQVVRTTITSDVRFFDCTQAGLTVKTGDKILISTTMSGVAQ